MVKKFIKGLLSKKEEKPMGKEEKSTEEVPSELPPLAEDTLKKAVKQLEDEVKTFSKNFETKSMSKR